MTITQSRPEGSAVDETEVLFHEARARRKRRWFIGGVTLSAVLVLLTVGVGIGLAATGPGRRPLQPAGQHPVQADRTLSAAEFSIRPLLCYAPPLVVADDQRPLGGPLPECSASLALTAVNLGVHPDTGTIAGYSENATPVQADPRFAGYGSTSPASDTANSTVLLPGATTGNGRRYVLGPVGLTASAIQSAKAVDVDGQWILSLTLTEAGSAQWDALAQQQFHAFIGVVVDGRVISAPITQPTQTTFSSFGGRVQISGNLTAPQARQLASRF
jgi:hypothetical protein